MDEARGIAAVVVTFNRRALLGTCLEALDRQELRPDRIIVIDNASTDDTAAYLEGLRMTGLEVHRMGSNSGGAGGFAYGIEKALDSGAEWIWLMDDDAEPTTGCLAALWDLPQRREGNHVLCPLIVGDSGEQLYHHKRIDPRTMQEHGLQSVPEEITAIAANAFVGPLFPASLARAHGLPCAEYFIWCDDLEYTYRISGQGKRIVLHPGARILHHDKVASAGDVAPWKHYYYYRNRLDFIVKHSEPEFLAACRQVHVKKAWQQTWRWFRERKFRYFHIPMMALYHHRIRRWGKVYDAQSFR